MKFTLRSIIFSWDFIISFLLFLVLSIFLPFNLRPGFTIEIYSVGISVIAIVFAVFFTSAAIIISSSDNNFLVFLEEDVGGYSILISSYKFTLVLLFIALIYSLTVYALTSYSVSLNGGIMHRKWFFIIFVFLFFYSLFATILAARDSFQFAKNRIRYLLIKR